MSVRPTWKRETRVRWICKIMGTSGIEGGIGYEKDGLLSVFIKMWMELLKDDCKIFSALAKRISLP